MNFIFNYIKFLYINNISMKYYSLLLIIVDIKSSSVNIGIPKLLAFSTLVDVSSYDFTTRCVVSLVTLFTTSPPLDFIISSSFASLTLVKHTRIFTSFGFGSSSIFKVSRKNFINFILLFIPSHINLAVGSPIPFTFVNLSISSFLANSIISSNEYTSHIFLNFLLPTSDIPNEPSRLDGIVFFLE